MSVRAVQRGVLYSGVDPVRNVVRWVRQAVEQERGGSFPRGAVLLAREQFFRLTTDEARQVRGRLEGLAKRQPDVAVLLADLEAFRASGGREGTLSWP